MDVNRTDRPAGEQSEEGIFPADAMTELRRIADALESVTGKRTCDGVRDRAVCALLPDHVGYHVTADGRVHWLDE